MYIYIYMIHICVIHIFMTIQRTYHSYTNMIINIYLIHTHIYDIYMYTYDTHIHEDSYIYDDDVTYIYEDMYM